jgi:hypothetical protein
MTKGEHISQEKTNGSEEKALERTKACVDFDLYQIVKARRLFFKTTKCRDDGSAALAKYNKALRYYASTVSL